MSTHAVPIERYHGTGNDFLVVDAAEGVGDRAAFARTHCHRETGVDAERLTHLTATSRLRSLAAVPALSAAVMVTGASAVAPSRVRRRLGRGLRRVGGVCKRAGRAVGRGIQRAGRRLAGLAGDAGSTCLGALEGCRQALPSGVRSR